MNEREIMRMLRAGILENATKIKVATQLLCDVAEDIGSKALSELAAGVCDTAQAEMFKRQYHDPNRG
jgi:hypothetical protein